MFEKTCLETQKLVAFTDSIVTVVSQEGFSNSRPFVTHLLLRREEGCRSAESTNRNFLLHIAGIEIELNPPLGLHSGGNGYGQFFGKI